MSSAKVACGALQACIVRNQGRDFPELSLEFEVSSLYPVASARARVGAARSEAGGEVELQMTPPGPPQPFGASMFRCSCRTGPRHGPDQPFMRGSRRSVTARNF
jgi:hypothetical protein